MGDEEIWKATTMYPDLEISSRGRVRSKHFRRHIRRPMILPYGKKTWVIRLNRESRYVPVYELMNDAFKTNVYTPDYRPSLSVDPPEDIRKYGKVGGGYIHVVGTPLYFKSRQECADHFEVSRQTIGNALRDHDGWLPCRQVRLEIVDIDDEDY